MYACYLSEFLMKIFSQLVKHKSTELTTMNVWRMFTHHIDRDSGLAWMRKNERIAIGWGRIGDIRKYKSKDDIKAAIKSHYLLPEFKNNAHWGAPSLWDFCHEVQVGDLVILAASTPRTLVVQVTGDYEFAKENWPLIGEFQNQRMIRETIYNPDKIWGAAGQAPGKSRYQTLIKCANPIELDDL